MKNYLTNYFDYIGLCNDEYAPRKEIYKSADKNIAPSYHNYIENLNNNQIQRQQAIENKISHVIGQSSVVISLIGLFIPLFLDKLNNENVFWKVILIIGFIGVIFHFVLSIWHSLKMYEIDKYKFMSGATSTITKELRLQDENDFINAEVLDLIKIVNHNNSVTNKVASNLVYASRCFKIGIVSLPIFILIIIISSFFIVNEPTKMVVENGNKQSTLDTNSYKRDIRSIITTIDSNHIQTLIIQKRLDSFLNKNQTDTSIKKKIQSK